MLSSRRLATLAISLRAIDGVLVEEVFGEDLEPRKEKDIEERIYTDLMDSMAVDTGKFRVAERVRKFFAEECTYPEVLLDLYRAYESLEKRRLAVLGELKKSSGGMSPVMLQEPSSE